MKKINEPLEVLTALVELYNDNEVINKVTWEYAERIVKKYKRELLPTLKLTNLLD